MHLDNIIIVADEAQKLRLAVGNIICSLNEFGFYLALEKSVLQLTHKINYCGLTIDTAMASFEVSMTCMAFFKELLRSPEKFSAQEWGYLAFWLFVLGLSSVTCLLLYHHGHVLLQILESGLWPLPQPPECLWATNTSGQHIAVTAPTQMIYKGPAINPHIFENELLGLFVTAYFAPCNTMILCDNMAVIGTMARRSRRPSHLCIATSIL